MEALRERALSTGPIRGAPWASAKDFIPLSSSAYRSGEDGVSVELGAPIEKVQAVLAKHLKPGRELLTAVRFTSGRIERVVGKRDVEGDVVPVLPPAEEKPAPTADPAAAVTVAAPVIGCPLPEFEAAEVRASRVLEAFLTPAQVEDYRATGAFMTIGRDSGHRYVVINRHKPEMLRKFGGRQLYDLAENVPCCVHDWEVPAPEEMLALHLCLSIPGEERRVRSLVGEHRL